MPIVPKLVVPGAYQEVSGMMAVENLLSSRQPFSAIFAANDQMAVGAAWALHKRSLPPLTTVHQPNCDRAAPGQT